MCATKLTDTLRNGSFEVVTNSVYESAYWWTSGDGYRALRGDITGPGGAPDGLVDIKDISCVSRAFGSKPGDPNWNTETNPEGPDLNGDGIVDIKDLSLVCSEFGKYMGKDAYCIDGVYSWYTSGGGDYQMWQCLCADVVSVLAGETIKFEFNFYPESAVSNGSQNNARAGIYYYTTSGDNTVYGSLVTPTYGDWWNVYVIVLLPVNTQAVAVIIDGKSDFKAWVDLAQVTHDNFYFTTAPYANQDTTPDAGCTMWMNAMICADASNSTGLTWVYSADASGIGGGRLALAKFNMNPLIGNSPSVYAEDFFRIGTFWEALGYIGSPPYSSANLVLHLYYFEIGVGWQDTGISLKKSFNSILYPGSLVYWFGAYCDTISPPEGSGTYAVVIETYTYAGGSGGLAVADFYFSYNETVPYFMYTYSIKISD